MTNKSDAIFEELKVNKLPSLPHILVDMLVACQSSTANYQQVSDIISRDAAITARVISLANSSFYSRGGKVNSLERALLVLGTETIKTIVITASVQQFFSGFNNAHTQYLKHFWRRSLSCALLAKSLATLTSYKQPEQAYLTGLLHNIGELVLETNHPEEYSQLIQSEVVESNQTELENKLFLTNHSDVGAWLIEQWNLGEFTSEAIRYHHSPINAVLDAHHLVKLIFLSSQLSKDNALEENASFEIAESMFGLSAALTKEIVVQIQNEVVKIAQSLSIDIDSDWETEIDKKKQVELAEQIRNAGLLQSTNNHLAQSDSLPHLFQGIQEAAELLFGYKGTQVLLIDKSDDSLKYRRYSALDDFNIETELSIPLEPSRSLIACSTVNKTIINSASQILFPDALPVIDQHFVKLTNSPNIIAVPMIVDGNTIGALVMGCSSKKEITPNTLHLLDYFSSEAANACEQLRSASQEAPPSSAEQELHLRINEVVHEASNPLSIVRNYLESLAVKLGDEHDAQSEIEILKEEIDRTGQIILRLRDLQQHEQNQEPGVDINQEILDLSKLFEGSLFLSHAVNCTVTLDQKLKRQQGNRNHIRQVLTNLIKNASEAMECGGELRLSTSRKVNVNGRDYVEIMVADKGPGIPDEVLGNLFHPVATTKGQGHSGLGLSITKNLITEMGGSISCRSSDSGTEMQVLIPVRNID
ncbi:HDOD domain-containing protein [Alkalimarinus sediminis]|uniref:histidine kinase n=1 Tax=Alkalimarinus sediminis TaxID=1632866 RepID=A0A9E8HK16_9ALTE|nr:HDOD domain-containing protein [Alkalimarinus sediminis]UZW75572.1 HDOD domain-containing protein [Alkalimarinus sediminis]